MAAFTHPKFGFKPACAKLMSVTEPLTKFGAVVVTVALILVPNNSEALLIKTAQ
jgi:hypothetical protein